MKRRGFKKVMAMLLAVVLAWPASALDVFAETGGGAPASAAVAAASAAGRIGESENSTAGGSVEFAIWSPGETVTGYAGQRNSFYARAEGATVYGLAERGGLDEAHLAIDAKTGEVTFTPETPEKSYNIKITAANGKETAEKAVKLDVRSRYTVVNNQLKLTPTDDARVQTWDASSRSKVYNAEASTGNETREWLTIQKALTDKDTGLMCERRPLVSSARKKYNDDFTFDSKMSALKFDLSQIAGGDKNAEVVIDSASLKMTYIGCRGDNDAVHVNKITRMAVAKLPSNNWTENNLSWKTWIELNQGSTNWDAMDDQARYTADDIAYSAEYSTGTNKRASWLFKQETTEDGKSAFPMDGRAEMSPLTIDVKKLVQKVYPESGGKKIPAGGTEILSLGLASSAAPEAEHYFLSKEGGDLFANAPKDAEGNPTGAPTLEIDYTKTVPSKIDGPDVLFLAEGYEATGSDSFSLVDGSSTDGEGTLDLDSTAANNTAVGKITWNDKARRFDIAEGIEKGKYTLTLAGKRGSGSEVTKSFTLYVVDTLDAPAFSSPSPTVNAYVGSPVKFTVKASMRREAGEEVVLLDAAGMNDMSGATFDKETGAFYWMPTPDVLFPPYEAQGYHEYDVVFRAKNSRNGLVTRYPVTIRVTQSRVDVAEENYIVAAKDTFIGSWGNSSGIGDSVKDLSAQNHLHVVKNPINGGTPSDEFGLLGEAGSPHDVKLALVNFNIDERLKGRNYDKVEMVMSFISSLTNVNGSNYAEPATVQIRAAKVKSSVKGYENLPWGNSMTWRNDYGPWQVGSGFRVAQEDIRKSPAYYLKSQRYIYHDVTTGVGSAALSGIDGSRIRTDVTDFVKSSIADGDTSMTVMFNTVAEGEGSAYKNGRAFVSREGVMDGSGKKYTNQTGRNGQKLIAPSLVMSSYKTGTRIEGDDEIVLMEGYADDTKTNSFRIPDYDAEKTNPVNVTALSPNAPLGQGDNIAQADLDKITWDTANSCLNIEDGLAEGSYTVKLVYELSVSANVPKIFEKTFTIKVEEDKVDALEDARTEFKAKKDNGDSGYAASSLAGYDYVVEQLDKILGTAGDTITKKVTGAEYDKAMALIKAFEGIIDPDTNKLLKVASYAQKVRERYNAKYCKEAYINADDYETWKSAAEEIGENYTGNETALVLLVDALRAAYGKLKIKTEVEELLAKIQEADGIIAEAANYSQSDIAALQTAKSEAEAVIAAGSTTFTSDFGTKKQALINALKIQSVMQLRLSAEIRRQVGLMGLSYADPDTDANAAKYTEATWDSYAAELKNAKKKITDETELTDAKIAAIISNLDTKMRALNTLSFHRDNVVRDVLDEIGRDNADGYFTSQDLWIEYDRAVDAAYALAGTYLTRASLEAALDNLNTKKIAVWQSRATAVTKSQLWELMNGVDERRYTNWDTLDMDARLEAVQAVYDDETVTDRRLAIVYADLQKVIQDLTERTDIKNFADLTGIVDECKDLRERDFHAAGWGGFQKALTNAKILTANSTDIDITIAYHELVSAREKLRARPLKNKKDLDSLLVDVLQLVKLSLDSYTIENREVIKAAIAEAQALTAQSPQDASPAVTDAYNNLSDAYGLPQIGKGDVSALAVKIRGENLSSAAYTAATYGVLQAALAEADKTASGADGAKSAKDAYNELYNARQNLQQQTTSETPIIKEEEQNPPPTVGPGSTTPAGDDKSKITAGQAVYDDKDTAAAGSKAEYKVEDVQARTVSLVKGKDEKNVVIAGTIMVGGKECKVVAIGDKAFAGAKNLAGVTISDDITKIGASAFSGCKKLTKVTIGKNVAEIGASAFSGCKKLGTLTIKSSAVKVKGSAFKGVKATIKVKMPGIKAAQKAKIKKMLISTGKMSKKAKF